MHMHIPVVLTSMLTSLTTLMESCPTYVVNPTGRELQDEGALAKLIGEPDPLRTLHHHEHDAHIAAPKGLEGQCFTVYHKVE